MKRLICVAVWISLSAACTRDAAAPAVVVSRVEISPNPASVAVGETVILTAQARTSDGDVVSGRPVQWSTPNPQVVSVGSDGSVTGLAAGSATVTATVDGVAGTAAVTVTPAPVNAVTVTLPATLEVGTSVQATATLLDKAGNVLTGRSVSWSSSNNAVATVTPAGVVTAVAPGTTTISAQSEGRSGSATLQAVITVSSITITPAAPRDIRLGRSVQLTATVRNLAGNVVAMPVAWTTSNPAMATVSSNGLVITHGATAGTVLITASAGGKSATVPLTTYGWVVETFASGVIRAFAVLRAEDAQAFVPTQTEWPEPPGLPELAVACGESNIVLVQLFAPRTITASGAVTYWFDNGTVHSAVWDESSSFKSLFHPGPQSATRAFITTLKAAETFTITFREFALNTLYSPVFRIGGNTPSGLAAVLPIVMAACPPTPAPALTAQELAERSVELSRALAAALEERWERRGEGR